MKKVLIIAGSLRRASLTTQLGKRIEAELSKSAEVGWLDYADVPLVNPDIEWPTPEPIARVRDEVMAADGVWIVSPEYNGSYPGHLKNLIDWLSRPLVEGGKFGESAIAGKPFTVSGAAGGSGSALMQEKLVGLLDFLLCKVMASPTTAVKMGRDSFSTDVLALSDEDEQAIHDQVAAFITFMEE